MEADLDSSDGCLSEAAEEKQRIMELLDAKLSDLIDKAAFSSAAVSSSSAEPIASADGESRLKQRAVSKADPLAPKEFRLRNSLLTDLFELAHFRTLQNAFMAIMAIFSLNTLVSDLLDGKSIMETLSLPVLFWAFGKIADTIAIWCVMHAAALLIVYPTFHHYVTMRNGRVGFNKSDAIWVGIYISFMLCLLVQPASMVLQHNLPPASASIVLMEQTRLLMKVHAFVWENAHNKHPNIECPSFGHYLYFLFAPTLVYRDSYPVSRPTRWSYVASNLAQVVGSTFFIYLLLVRYCMPMFSDWRWPDLRKFVQAVFHSALPGGLLLLIGFFAILHSWLNAFAEMMRFGDRLFYRDWWNVTSFRTWFRTWNCVVHDWLYTYVYRELCLSLGLSYRPLAAGCVFFLSALFHEYILSFSFGFFFPALFLFFNGAGFALMFARGHSRFWSVFVWASLFLGMGALVCLYSMEWFARRNCLSLYPHNAVLDFVVPRFVTC